MNKKKLGNFSEEQQGSLEDTASDNNSPSSDSESDTSKQIRTMRELKKTIEINQRQLRDLGEKLKEAETLVNFYKEKCKDKDELIASLKTSIELSSETIKLIKGQKAELQTSLPLHNNLNIPKLDGNPTNLSDMPSNMALKNLESKIREKEIMLEKLETKVETDHNIISNLKSQIRDKDILLVNFEDKAQADKNENKEQRKAISGLKKKISELEDKLKQTNENLAIYKKQGTAEEMVASSPMILFNYTKTSMEIFKARNVEALHKLDLNNLTIGSGWIVVQKHFNDGEDFDTPVISEISDSFQDQSLGTPEESFWLGCELLHKITTGRRHELYILLSYFNGHQIYALYDDFVVGPGPDYKLKSLGKYEGDAGDGLRSHENQKFRSYSLSSESVCSRWWESKDDGYFNLNVPYRSGKLYIEPNEFVCASRMFIRPRT